MICRNTRSMFQLILSILALLSRQVASDRISIGPAEAQLLLPAKIDDVAKRILDAVKPRVAAFLLSTRHWNFERYRREAMIRYKCEKEH